MTKKEGQEGRTYNEFDEPLINEDDLDQFQGMEFARLYNDLALTY